MDRPTLTLATIAPQTRGWDAVVDTNFDAIKEIFELKPIPLCLVYDATPSAGAISLASVPAADYGGCFAYLTDAASPSTNGYLIFSDGTDWRYQRTHTAV